MPTKPEAQEKLGFLGYRNMLEKLAERYHTTPQTIVALNGPDKLIGMGQTLKLPNVVPQSRDYDGRDRQAGAPARRVQHRRQPAEGRLMSSSTRAKARSRSIEGSFPTGEGDWGEAGTAG